MIFSRFIAKQLGKPKGVLGTLIVGLIVSKRNRVLNEVAFQNLRLTSMDRVLEVGFGGGNLMGKISEVVNEGYVVGVEISATMVEFCGKKFRKLIRDRKMEIKVAKAESLPYISENFTKVCSVNSVFYWDNVPKALSEFWRVLVEDGLLVLCFTCKESLEKRNFPGNFVSLYETDEIRGLIESAGFHQINVINNSDKYRKFVCVTGKK
jgi:ubiquinone/menaquinone biosynthesis C-methylase UbiE